MKYLILFLLAIGFGSACVDINTASLSELDEIIWVGPATAQKIIDARPFEDLDDLKRVVGIGDVKVSDIKEEGVACVGDDEDAAGLEVEPEVDEVAVEDLVSQKAPVDSPMITLSSKEETISLNSNTGKGEEIVYESKNFRAINFAPYGLSLILIVLVVILAWDKF